jgi:alkylated DNA nucleotide flippase Atl1
MAKYAALTKYLEDQTDDGVVMSFPELDELIDQLPPSARSHRPWWANAKDSAGQARGWLDAGWSVKSVDMDGEQVTFVRGDGDASDSGGVRRAFLIRSLFEVLENASLPMAAAEALAAVEQSVELSEIELSRNPSGTRRFDTFLRFVSSWANKVGWMSKRGGWALTEAGVDAMHMYDDVELYRTLTRLYREKNKKHDKRGQTKTQRQARVLAALDAVEAGSWTSFTDLREALGITDNQIYADIEGLPAREAMRVLRSDGALSSMKNLIAEDQKAVLVAEGVTFDVADRADQEQRVGPEVLIDAIKEIEDARKDDDSSPVGVLVSDATAELAAELHIPLVWLQECIDLLCDRPQLIFYGPPGTGKTFIAQRLAEHIAGDNVRLVQFHPAYSYEDFFEGYRPNPEGGFELKFGPMRKIALEAKDDPSTPFVLIIDEINRGNLAKVFGELYFLLEYREKSVDLLYSDSGGGFTLPPNVFIIATMNTADRSIALVDTAMRRRFAFMPLHPSEVPASGVLRSWLRANGLSTYHADLLEALNARIEDPDFKIGPSYFMRSAVHDPQGLERMWRTSLLPLLEEHHFGEMSRNEVADRYGLAAIEASIHKVDEPAPDQYERTEDVENATPPPA